jgi:hypothetical protein
MKYPLPVISRIRAFIIVENKTCILMISPNSHIIYSHIVIPMQLLLYENKFEYNDHKFFLFSIQQTQKTNIIIFFFFGSYY